ncbi:MAG TPA: carbohydrate ABC transporter permease, partial [Candidatus Humimicrobiaceae bacterium]
MSDARKNVGKKSMKYKMLKGAVLIVLICLAIVFVFPFLWMVSTSLKSLNEFYKEGIHLFVKDVRFDNYVKALTILPFLTYLKNTLLTTLIPVTFTCISCSMVGYGFARVHAPGAKILFFVMLSTMMLPSQVTMIPNYILFKNLGWLDSLYPLIIPSMFSSPFYVFLARQFYMRMPSNLEDAAKIDGCGAFKTWFYVYFPLTKPILATIAIFTFIGCWNDFMGPLIYINSDKY